MAIATIFLAWRSASARASSSTSRIRLAASWRLSADLLEQRLARLVAGQPGRAFEGAPALLDRGLDRGPAGLDFALLVAHARLAALEIGGARLEPRRLTLDVDGLRR